MKNDSNKKNGKIIILIIIIAIIIGAILIANYYFGTWIRYGENIPPRDATIWNAAESYRITVTRTGTIKGNFDKNRLNKDEMTELKSLVKQIEKGNPVKNSEDTDNGLFINGKKYEMDNNNMDAYERIRELIK